jgi:succinate dehydrogenase/fumarate reductase cytochrome b subunit
MMRAMTPAATRSERWFRASGVAPLGAFALLHVLVYSQVLLGQREFGDRDAAALSPLVLGLELLLVVAPLAFHAGYGLALMARRPLAAAPGTLGVLDRVQRYSSLLVLVFIGDHYLRFRWPMVSGHAVPSDAYSLLVRELSSTVSGVPLVAALHLLGISALAFHLGYGIYRHDFRTVRWLATSTRRTALALTVGLLVLVPGSFAVIELATGKKLLPIG